MSGFAADSGTSMRWRAAGRTIAIAGLVLIAVIFLKYIPKTIEVFIVATLIAYGVNPIVIGLSRRLPRLVAIASVYAMLIAAVLVAAVIIIPDTIDQLQKLLGNSGSYLDAIQRLVNGVQAWLQHRFKAQIIPAQFQNIENQALSQLSGLFNAAIQSVGSIVLSIANIVLIGITAVTLSYYMLTHVDEIRASFYSLFPERSQPGAHRFAHQVGRVFGGFVLGQIVLCLFSGALTFAVLFAFRSQYALLLGVLTGLLYAVPYLGVVVAVVVGLLLGLAQSWNMALITALTIFLITRVADYLLVPKIMAESVGISPIAIIFAVFAGGELFGLWGLVLAIPGAALFKVVWNLWIHPWLTGRAGSDVTFAPAPIPPAVPERMPGRSALSGTAKDVRS